MIEPINFSTIIRPRSLRTILSPRIAKCILPKDTDNVDYLDRSGQTSTTVTVQWPATRINATRAVDKRPAALTPRITVQYCEHWAQTREPRAPVTSHGDIEPRNGRRRRRGGGERRRRRRKRSSLLFLFVERERKRERKREREILPSSRLSRYTRGVKGARGQAWNTAAQGTFYRWKRGTRWAVGSGPGRLKVRTRGPRVIINSRQCARQTRGLSSAIRDGPPLFPFHLSRRRATHPLLPLLLIATISRIGEVVSLFWKKRMIWIWMWRWKFLESWRKKEEKSVKFITNVFFFFF